MDSIVFRNRLWPMLIAAAALSGCASSDRMMRLSPLSEGLPEQAKEAGDAQRARLATPALTEDRVNAFPLYYSSGGMTSVLWPLADWDDRGCAFRPFYNRECENRSVLFPVSAWDDRSGWVLNTVWDKDKGWMFAPFFGSWRDTDFVFPVFVTHHAGGADTVRVWPVWYSDANEWRLEPLLSRERRADGAVERSALLGAIWWQSTSADGAHVRRWVLPAGWWEKDGADSRLVTLPVSAGRRGDRSWFNVHPLWWSSESPGYASETLVPLWHRRKVGEDSDLWTPVGRFERRGGGRADTTWLYSAGNEAGETWLNIHPLWWSSESEGRSSRLLFPLWSENREGEHTTVRTLLGLSERDGENRRTLTWLYGSGRRGDETWFNVHPLWWSSDSSSESVRVLAPLWWSRETSSGSQCFTPLGWRTREGDTRSVVTWLYSATESPGASSFNLHPLWWSGASKESSHRVLAPLWFEFHDKDAESLYTPLGLRRSGPGREECVTWLHSAGHEGDRSWFNLHPLWWSSHSGARDSEWMLPLWWHRREGARDGVYTPLGMYEREGEDRMWGTIPFSSGRVGDRSWFNLHPLWWSYESKDESLQALLPLWWSTRNGDRRALYTPLGWGESSGADYRRVTLPYSSGRAGERSWFNVHPLWWSSVGPSGRTEALLPLWAKTTGSDGSGTLLSPLGFQSYAPGGDTDTLNALGFVYQWRREDAVTESRHVLWPLWKSRRADAEVNGEAFLGAFALGASESAKNVEAFRLTPLYSQGRGPGVSSFRDWCHLVSRRERAGEASVTVTPLAESVSHAAGTRLRLTPLLSSAEYQTDTEWRDWLHLFSFRGDESGHSRTLTPLAAHHEAHGDSLWRLTPLFRSGEGRFAEFTPWSPHLFTLDRKNGRRSWSFTPLFGGLETDGSESTRAWPFYWREAREGRTLDTGVFPFRSSGEGEGFWLGGCCAWRHREMGEETRTSFLGPVWSRRVSRMKPAPGRPLFAEGETASVVRTDSLLTSSREGVAFRWLESGPDAATCRTLANWYDSRRQIRAVVESGADASARGYYEADRVASLRSLHAEAGRILSRHGYAPAGGSVADTEAALNRLCAAYTTTVPMERFAVDPLWVDWYRSESAGNDASWELLFGLARGERRGESGRVSVLHLLYAKEYSAESMRMNCFPFIQRDESKSRRKVSFLGRVWNRETDLATGRSHGHILFIPW